jgi:hypothetical protein
VKYSAALVAAAAAVLVAMPACGGNGGGDDTAPGSAIDPAAQTRAESTLLKLADFPNGWRASAPEDQGGQEKFNKCLGVDLSGLTKIGDADSQDFEKGDSTQASSSATIYKSDQQAQDAISEAAAGMSGTAAEGCFQDVVEKAARGEKGFKLGDVDIGELKFTPPDVDEAKAWQIVIPLEVTSGALKGLSPDVYIELTALREGDTVASVFTEDVLSEFDPALRNQLVQTVAGRISGSS